MSRELFLTIGKKSYSIKTPLDDDVLERVRDLIDEACGAPVRGVNQEDLLILACLRLAYSLDNATMRLNDLLSRLNAACGAEILSLDENNLDENNNVKNIESVKVINNSQEDVIEHE